MPAPEHPDELDAEPIPLSALQHAVYCLRQAALIHLERMWAENRFTAEGKVLHAAAHEAGTRNVRGVRRITALHISSKRLGIAGVADAVEFHAVEDGETAYPIEYKRGKVKLHRADEVQLCAQALCLEEMTGRAVPMGALFYAETKRRTEVCFDPDLRALTERTIAEVRTIFTTRKTPSAVYKADRCRACSLIDLCHPRLARKKASQWRAHMVTAHLAGDEK